MAGPGTVLLALALAGAPLPQGRPGSPDAPWPEVEVSAGGGRFVAEIAKARGQERVRDPLARWRLAVFRVGDGGGRELFWEELYPYDGRPRRFFLSDDGTTLVHVAEPFSSHRAVVRIDREGEEVAELTGDELGVERTALAAAGDAPAWIASGADAVRLAWRRTSVGPWLALEIDVRDGTTLVVDAGTGGRYFGEPAPEAVRVRPGVPDEVRGGLEEPYVTSVSAPSHALAGAPVVLQVEGDHPTPNWRLVGFRVARAEGGERSLELVPLAAPPEGGRPVAQVLHGFRHAVAVEGLDPGRWTLAVRGRGERSQSPPPAVVEVLPARTRARLRVTGGISGVERRVELFAPGVVDAADARDGPGAASSPRYLPRAAERRLDALLAALPPDPVSRTSSAASDLFTYELGWWSDGAWWEARVDDETAAGPIREAVAALRDLADPAPPAPR